MKIYDRDNKERDWDWLEENFGAVSLSENIGPCWYVEALREKVGPATLVVKALNEDRTPAEGLEVAFYWPDADEDENAGPEGGPPEDIIPNRCVHGPTNTNGDVGFGMGPGAYYDPKKAKGPHAVWIYGADTPSQVVTGLGMLMGTNHAHLDVTYRWEQKEKPDPEPEPEPDPEPEPEPDADNWEILAHYLAESVELLEDLRQAILDNQED